MDAFITRASAEFDAPPAEVEALTAAVLWVMQISAPDAFARVHTSDPQVRVLVDGAPAVLARARDPHTRRTDHALLRLFAASGFSLAQAGRFVRRLLDLLDDRVGADATRRIVRRAAVIELLLAEPDDDLPSALASFG